MKAGIIGYPNASSWKLLLDEISTKKQLISLKGELRVDFFHAVTPMCIAPDTLAQFAADLRKLDESLSGSATLESKNRQSTVKFTLAVNHVGHIHAQGRFEINGNSLDFGFDTDQTQLAPFVKWLDAVVLEYKKHCSGLTSSG